MNTMLLLTQIFGLFFVTAGFSMLINKKFFKKMFKEIETSHLVLFFSGAFNLILGLIVVLHTNTYGTAVESIISILGWLMTAKGVLLIVFPKGMRSLTAKMKWVINMLPVLGLIYIALGGYLVYNGFYL